MTLRTAALGFLLAAAGQAQGTDGMPITMHNDPMTVYNGSIQVKRMERTSITPVNNSQLGFNPIQNFLLTHAHGGQHTVLFLKPVGSTGNLTVAKQMVINDGDALHIYLRGQPTTGNGEIVIRRQTVPGAHNFIAAHAHLDEEFVKQERALQYPAPATTTPAGGYYALPATDVSGIAANNTASANSGLRTKAAAPAATASAPPPASAPAAKPTLADLISAQKRAAAVADTVWVIQATKGFFEPADKNGNKLGAWLSPLPNVPRSDINPAPNDDPFSVWARYADTGAKMAAAKIMRGDAVTAELSEMPECAAIHFCHMKDVADKQGNWTLKTDCGPVQYTCQGRQYKLEQAPATGISRPATGEQVQH